MKNQDVGLIIGAIVLIVGILFITGNLPFFGVTEPPYEEEPSVSIITEEVDRVLLPYCSTKTECIDYLINQGMSPNFLELNRLTISCENGECYVQK